MDFHILYVLKSHNMILVGKDGGLVHPIVTIGNELYIMKTRTHMSTTNIAQDNKDMREEEKEERLIDPIAIKWEEWALSAEEHFHALQKFRENPRGRPMGHKA